jgi:hypothetical protein
MRRLARAIHVFRNPLDFPQDGVERMLQRPVKPVPLRRLQLGEIGFDALAGLVTRRRPRLPDVPRHIISREYGLGQIVRGHWCGLYNA